MAEKRGSLWNEDPVGGDHEWLAPATAGTRVRPYRPPVQPPPEPPRRRSRTLVALVAIALLLVGLGGAALFNATVDQEESEPLAALPATSGRTDPTRINEIYSRASAGVVSVQVASRSGRASGTGFLVDADGTIVTNAHVVGNADGVQVRLNDVDRPVPAEVLGSDPSSDLAVLRVNPTAVRTLSALPLADSDAVKVGDTAIAIGYPLGLDRTATAGIVSGLGREIRAPNGFRIDKVIQTDAPINPGNSGGPLLDDRGRVIGVNSQIASTSSGGGNVGIGFAVPANTVRTVVPQLKAGRTIQRPYLGVSTTLPLHGAGAVVRGVVRGGPAELAGLRPAREPDGSDGDVIVSVDGRAVTGPDDVADAIQDRQPGDHVDVVVRRRGARVSVNVELGRRPGSSP